MSDYPATTTLAELDRIGGLAKGSAFRAFKRLEAELLEGKDFTLLTAASDAAGIKKLKAEGRVYASSIIVVLLAPDAAQKILAAMGESG